MLLFFITFFEVSKSDDYVNKLRGTWEMIPITDSLSNLVDFIPINIDDTEDEVDSTMDMIIFQSSKNIE